MAEPNSRRTIHVQFERLNGSWTVSAAKSESTLLLSLMATVSSLPSSFSTLTAGAIERRKPVAGRGRNRSRHSGSHTSTKPLRYSGKRVPLQGRFWAHWASSSRGFGQQDRHVVGVLHPGGIWPCNLDRPVNENDKVLITALADIRLTGRQRPRKIFSTSLMSVAFEKR
jgi:hypothetical protein